MTSTDSILCEHRPDGIRIITLSRPAALNAITLAMSASLAALLDGIAGDREARCIILTGAGTRAFSAGFDIKEMADFDSAQMLEAFVARDPLMLRIAEHPLPVIAALNGIAYGAGALIAAACDFRVAGPEAEFKVTAIGYGSANATWSLPRLVGPARAKDILMTGRSVFPAEGLAIGLFDRLATAGQTLDHALEFALQIIRHPASGVAATKALVGRGQGCSLAEAWAAEHQMMVEGLSGASQPGAEVFGDFLAVHGRQS